MSTLKLNLYFNTYLKQFLYTFNVCSKLYKLMYKYTFLYGLSKNVVIKICFIFSKIKRFWLLSISSTLAYVYLKEMEYFYCENHSTKGYWRLVDYRTESKPTNPRIWVSEVMKSLILWPFFSKSSSLNDFSCFLRLSLFSKNALECVVSPRKKAFFLLWAIIQGLWCTFLTSFWHPHRQGGKA